MSSLLAAVNVGDSAQTALDSFFGVPAQAARLHPRPRDRLDRREGRQDRGHQAAPEGRPRQGPAQRDHRSICRSHRAGHESVAPDRLPGLLVHLPRGAGHRRVPARHRRARQLRRRDRRVPAEHHRRRPDLRRRRRHRGCVGGLVARTMGDTPTGKVVGSVVPVLVMAIATFMILNQLQIAAGDRDDHLRRAARRRRSRDGARVRPRRPRRRRTACCPTPTTRARSSAARSSATWRSARSAAGRTPSASKAAAGNGAADVQTDQATAASRRLREDSA